MKTYKTRKQGNSITITIPKDLDISAGKEYVVIKGEGGAFTYIPKEENIFKKAFNENISLRITDELEHEEAVGREVI